jgi:DMSO/TMAO reductase YedYZ molybdopterin-dependent catalytic subunit
MSKSKFLIIVMSVAILIAGCSAQPLNIPPTTTEIPIQAPSPTVTPTPEAPPANTLAPITSSCGLAPIIAPTMAPNPGFNALDKVSGLHITGHPVTIDLNNYRLVVTGLVDHPLSLTYDELRCMPKVTADLTLTCPQVFEDRATWSGVQLKYVLALAGVQSSAKVVVLVAADKYQNQMYLADALKEDNFLAYEQDGQPLPALHGFPLRGVFPGMPGSNWVKWLVEIRVK